MFAIDRTFRRLPLSPVLAALALGLALGSSVAAAAPPPTLGGGGGAGPEEEACAGRSIGDGCTLPNRQLGTCGEGTCSRLDYSGGSPPKAVEEPCVVCKAGGGHGGPPALGTGGPPAGEDGEDGPGSSSGGASKGKEPPESSSRCSAESTDDIDPVGGLALVLLLGLGLRRRDSA